MGTDSHCIPRPWALTHPPISAPIGLPALSVIATLIMFQVTPLVYSRTRAAEREADHYLLT